MKTKPISEETRGAILDATWSLVAKKKRLDVNQTEVAAAAGVSRQTIYLAFGNRAGLLTAMLRHKDLQSDHVERLVRISQADTVTPEDLERYIDVWIEYLPLIYPVGVLLDAASVTDEEAASAWDDRMKGALLAGLKRILKHLAKRDQLAQGTKPERAAEQLWSLIHPTAWRQLVIGCGWSPVEFRRSRIEIARAVLLR